MLLTYLEHRQIHDDARLRDGIPKEDPMLANGWVTDQPTFNYKLPCDLDKTPAGCWK
jgi:hypothetical protein